VRGLSGRVGLLDRRVDINLIGRRTPPQKNPVFGSGVDFSGTVVLAVIGPGVEVSKVVTTGLGNDRSANMLEFARLALEYLLEQMEKEQ
jgi:hypothetical protein